MLKNITPEMKAEINNAYERKFKATEFVPGETYVPASGKVFDVEEMEYMTDAVLDGWWTEGRFTQEFESRLADYLGVPHCVTTNSGSSANLLAISALTSFRLRDRQLKKGGGPSS